VVTAGAILKSAAACKESRGVHVRSDYLFTDDQSYLKNTVVDDPALHVHFEDAVQTRMRPGGQTLPYTAYIEKVIDEL